VRKSQRDSIYRQPSREVYNKILFTGFKLNELFDPEEIADFAAAARRRIIGEFFYAKEKNPRYKPGSDRSPQQRTDNYIWGLKNKLSDLASFVNQRKHRRFIQPFQLAEEFNDYNPNLVDKVIHRAEFDILVMVAETMRSRGEIWYDEGVGIWQIAQSSVDEWTEYKRRAKSLFKVDDRNFHGRVRAQSKSRGIPAGTSIGLT